MDSKEKAEVFKTFHERIGHSSVRGTLAFTCAADRGFDGMHEEEKKLEMFLAYTSETLFVYEIADLGPASGADLRVKLRCSQRVFGHILSLVNFGGLDEGKPVFLLLFEEGRIASFTYNPSLEALETLALHRLDNRKTQNMLRSTISKPVAPLLRTHPVLRESCLLSIHLIKKLGRQLFIDGRPMQSPTVLFDRDFVERDGADFYSNSMTIDLHILGIHHVSDFAFVVFSSFIVVYVVCSLPGMQGYSDRLLEVTLTQPLIQKLQVQTGRDDKIKENVKPLNFLPPEILKIFVLSNQALVVVTADGVFYIHSQRVYLLAYDPEVCQKYSSEKYSGEFKSLCIRLADLRRMVSRQEVRLARYSCHSDVLLIETPHFVFEVLFTVSAYDASRLSTFQVAILKDLKDSAQETKHSFSLLFSTNWRVGTFLTTHEFCLFKAPPAKRLPLPGGEKQELAPYFDINLSIEKVEPQVVSLVRYNIQNLTDVCTISSEACVWDYVCISTGEGKDYIMLMHEDMKLETLDRLQLDGSYRLLRVASDCFVLTNPVETLYFLLAGGRINSITHEDMRVQLVLDPNDKILAVHEVNKVHIFVYENSIRLRSPQNEKRLPFDSRVFQHLVSEGVLFILTEDGGFLPLAISIDSDYKIKIDQLPLTLTTADRKLASVAVAGQLLCAAYDDGYLRLFDRSAGDFTPTFTAYVMDGRHAVENAGHKERAKHASRYSIKKVLLLLSDDDVYLLIYTNICAVWMYRLAGDRLIRCPVDLSLFHSNRYDTDLQLFPLNKHMHLICGDNLRTSVLLTKQGEVIVHKLHGVADDKVFVEADGTIVSLSQRGSLAASRLLLPDTYCSMHPYPFAFYIMKDLKILRVTTIEREDNDAVVLLCKTLPSADAPERYKLLLFNLAQKQVVDRYEFEGEETVVNVKKICVESKALGREEMLCVMYVSKFINSVASRCRLVGLKSEMAVAGGSLKFELRDLYSDQETNEIITNVFNIDEYLFLCIDNRIVQMQIMNNKSYALMRTYHLNCSYIVDAAVRDKNNVLLTNLKGSIVFMIWIKEDKKLKQKNQCALGHEYLYFGRFLDDRQSKLVCCDSSRSVNVMKVVTEGISDGRDNIVLKISRVQRLRLTSKSHACDRLKHSEGLVVVSSDGSIDVLRSKCVNYFEDFLKIYSSVIMDVPYACGMNPLSQHFTHAATEAVEMDPTELFDSAVIALFASQPVSVQDRVFERCKLNRLDAINSLITNNN